MFWCGYRNPCGKHVIGVRVARPIFAMNRIIIDVSADVNFDSFTATWEHDKVVHVCTKDGA
jgi:hypothetical protein